MKFDAPLGIPQGSVRAVIALSVIGAAIVSLFIGVNEEAKTFIFTLAGTAFGHYFGARQSETQGSAPTGEPLPASGLIPDEPLDESETRIVPGAQLEEDSDSK